MINLVYWVYIALLNVILTGETNGRLNLTYYKQKETEPLPHAYNEHNYDLIKHNILPSNHSNFSNTSQLIRNEYNPKPSLSEGKFGKGFNRRQASSIENQISEERKQYMNEVTNKQMNHSIKRVEYLKTRDNRTGYNIISGQDYTDPQLRGYWDVLGYICIDR